uniref:Uncharacterized protein n=1 Tax=Avena sativa TaxID=4498 RepID=A0ACD5U588_AVESA
MWPRTEEEPKRQRNCGFVAFMNRAEGHATKAEMQGVFLYDYELKIGWGKSVALPSQALPAPPPGEMAIRSKEGGIVIISVTPQTSELAGHFLHMHLPFCFVMYYATIANTSMNSSLLPWLSQEVLTPNVPDNVVTPPDDSHLRHVIDTMTLHVLDGGCAFEQTIMERGRVNSLFNFLFDLKSKEHTYYVWRFSFFLRHDDSKTGNGFHLLRHPAESLNVKKNLLLQLAEAGITAEALKERVLKVLQVWADWFLFSDAYLNGMKATFHRSVNFGVTHFHSLCDDAPEIEKKTNSEDGNNGFRLDEDGDLAIGKATSTKELLGLLLSELERRCRHNGLSLCGGKEMMVARLLSLEEFEKERVYQKDVDMKYLQGDIAEISTDHAIHHPDTIVDEEHRQKLRKIEIAVMQYHESLEEKGLRNIEGIERKVASHRRRLLSEYGLSSSIDGANKQSSGINEASTKHHVYI